MSSLVERLQKMFPSGAGLHEPRFEGREWEYVKECLDTGWVSSVGKYVDRFERDLETYTGAKRAIAVANGTAALQVCLQLVGVKRGDEVLMPALTFVATANAAAYLGAIPHFVDCDEKTLGVDPLFLEKHLSQIVEKRGEDSFNRQTGRRIRALIVMHTFGHPVDLDPLNALMTRYGIELVEDAAESLGSFYKGKHTGRIGRVSALSFNGNKIVTSGGGGAILTDDETIGNHAKHLTTTAKVPHAWEYVHDETGYNFRLPNLNAALGCAQLESLPTFLAKKRKLAERYAEALNGLKGTRFFVEPSHGKSNYWLNAVLLDQPNVSERNRLLKACHEAKILARPAWQLMSELPMYRDCPKMDLSCSQSLAARIINLPSSSFL